MYGEKMFPKDVVLQSDLKKINIKKISEGRQKSKSHFFDLMYFLEQRKQHKSDIFSREGAC